jgi:predicted RNase H-like HicB family nuclease
MSTVRYVQWQDGDMWLGYFEEFPDYMTQGESLAELEENLRDMYKDLTSGEILGIRKVSELIPDEADRPDCRLKDAGCVLDRNGGSHDWYRNPKRE